MIITVSPHMLSQWLIWDYLGWKKVKNFASSGWAMLVNFGGNKAKSRTLQLRDAVVLRPRLVWMSAVVLSCFEFPPPPFRGETAGLLMTSSGSQAKVSAWGFSANLMLFESLCLYVTLCRVLVPNPKTTAVFLILPKHGMVESPGRIYSFLEQRSIFQVVFFHNSGGFEHIFHWKCWFNR